MPPRKKARVSSHPPSSVSVDTPGKESTPKASSNNDEMQIDTDADLWTDEQEIALFKGVIKLKPVGPFPAQSHCLSLRKWAWS